MQVLIAIPSAALLVICAPGADRSLERASQGRKIDDLVKSMQAFDWGGALYLVSHHWCHDYVSNSTSRIITDLFSAYHWLLYSYSFPSVETHTLGHTRL